MNKNTHGGEGAQGALTSESEGTGMRGKNSALEKTGEPLVSESVARSSLKYPVSRFLSEGEIREELSKDPYWSEMLAYIIEGKTPSNTKVRSEADLYEVRRGL